MDTKKPAHEACKFMLIVQKMQEMILEDEEIAREIVMMLDYE